MSAIHQQEQHNKALSVPCLKEIKVQNSHVVTVSRSRLGFSPVCVSAVIVVEAFNMWSNEAD